MMDFCSNKLMECELNSVGERIFGLIIHVPSMHVVSVLTVMLMTHDSLFHARTQIISLIGGAHWSCLSWDRTGSGSIRWDPGGDD